MILNTIHSGDALSVLKTLPDNSVHTCVTSPPYLGLRDYGADGQIGLEETPEQYVAALVEVFREVKRVLRGDGTLWLNLGDSYAGSGAGGGGNRKGNEHGQHDALVQAGRPPVPKGVKAKDLLGTPWLVAFALRTDGWYLRSDIIWSKPNVMPESVEDRPTKSHEYLFLLAKSPRYYYDSEAIKEPATWQRENNPDWQYQRAKTNAQKHETNRNGKSAGFTKWNSANGRNKRTVWIINTQPFKSAHFAVMPEALVEPCILAGCPETICAVCGAPYVRQIKRTPMKIRRTDWGEQAGNRTATSGKMLAPPIHKTLGFAPTCACNADTTSGIVIDPFFGSGTVGVVAKRLHRNYIGIELNPKYIRLAERRINMPPQQAQAEEAGFNWEAKF